MAAVKLYPNPTTGMLSMDWGTKNVTAKMTVSNVIGQTMIEQEINGKSHHDVDLSHLPGGNYIVTLRSNDGAVSTHKVLLSK